MRKQPSKNWLRQARWLASKGAGMWAAAMLVLLSFLMIINNFHIISFHFQRSSFVRELEEGRVFFTSVHNTLGEHILGPEDRRDREQMRKFLLDTRDDTLPTSFLEDFNNTEDSSALHVKGRKPPASITSAPTLHYDRAFPLNHPCQGFSIPPPPADKKRTGPRPCPVCYLPVEQAIRAMPSTEMGPSSVLKNLTFFGGSDSADASLALSTGSEFGGHPTLEDRNQSHHIREEMSVHCGFVKGREPGFGSGFDISDEDRAEMHKCHGIVVGSAIFGNYDELQQPKNISKEAREKVCFFMFIDEETGAALLNNANLQSTRKIGLWNMVVVRNLPYADARRNGKIPKLLIHRLFPNARYSLWVDGKLELVVDPYQILERFLWRTYDTFAISKHYARFDVFVEAEANKAAGKYDNASIDAQVDFYRSEGLTPYNSKKLPIVSDVPEGCVIIREHTPVTNLFGCLWFNEVDRFTSRDQLSFAIVRDNLVAQIPWRVNMFLDCERRNFVVQAYHRDVMMQKAQRGSKRGKSATVAS
ncbi:unnamed protein product [Calypogeia fissa]